MRSSHSLSAITNTPANFVSITSIVSESAKKKDVAHFKHLPFFAEREAIGDARAVFSSHLSRGCRSLRDDLLKGRSL